MEEVSAEKVRSHVQLDQSKTPNSFKQDCWMLIPVVSPLLQANTTQAHLTLSANTLPATPWLCCGWGETAGRRGHGTEVLG